jgi:hypothetical protein
MGEEDALLDSLPALAGGGDKDGGSRARGDKACPEGAAVNEGNRSYVQAVLREDCDAKLLTKGREYARGDPDLHSNFNRTASALDITRGKVLAVHLLKHLDSIIGFLNGERGTEKVHWRIVDAINYLRILDEMAWWEDNEHYRDA